MQVLLNLVLGLLGPLGEGLRGVAPVIGIPAPVIRILLVFQLVVLRQPLQNWWEVTGGLGLTVVGLVIFLKGQEVDLTPLEGRHRPPWPDAARCG